MGTFHAFRELFKNVEVRKVEPTMVPNWELKYNEAMKRIAELEQENKELKARFSISTKTF